MNNLHNLPKDLLIKLVQTIEEETKKECLIEFEKEKKKLAKMCFKSTYYFCDYCGDFEVYSGDLVYTSKLKAEIEICDYCNGSFCKDHNIIQRNVEIRCKKCNINSYLLIFVVIIVVIITYVEIVISTINNKLFIS